MADAYTILEGTNAVINPQFGLNTSSGNVSNTAIGWANQATFSFRRDTFSLITFNTSGGWDNPLPRMISGVLSLSGYQTIHDPLSDPLAMITVTQPLPFLLTVTPPNGATAVTLTGKVIEVGEDGTFAALDASGRQQSFKTYGPVTSSWTVS